MVGVIVFEVMENWSFPIRTFFQRLFGGGGGRFAGPKWNEVVEIDYGNPPDLNSNKLSIDLKTIDPFNLIVIKAHKYKLRNKINGVWSDWTHMQRTKEDPFAYSKLNIKIRSSGGATEEELILLEILE